MPPRDASERRLSKTGRRVSKAGEYRCKRCRNQKIRCTGSQPCDQCSKRGLACYFESQSQRVVVTRRYIDTLHARLATLQNKASRPASPAPVSEQVTGPKPNPMQNDSQPPRHTLKDHSSKQNTVQDGTKAKAPLTNPLAFHMTDWVPGPKGQPIFMGTSSSWAFARRVFGMTCGRLEDSSWSGSLLFDGNVYDMKWDGSRRDSLEDIYDISNLPTPDFAGYLINSVKFHCGQLLYLFDESNFMSKFVSFQQSPEKEARSSPLWFCHYLLLLAFGKSFVVQSAKSTRPAGSDHFIQAMKCMPDFSFFEGDPIEKTQVLCCAALFLQCLNNRTAAYRMIGLALRTALENGMYTEMHSTYLSETYVQRCNFMWWTVYVLERRLSSLMGVPMGIAEESISTPFPSTYRYQQGSNVMEMQVKLCQVLAKIDQTVYGIEGKLDSRYLGATQSVLRSIAKVTQELNSSFDLYGHGATTGISRISAHLHLLEHHCIILTTRPLLYIFLQSKLRQSDPALMDWLQSETVKNLLHMCVESAQQIVRILSILLDQGLLDSFLPFDMDAACTATISLLMSATIDPSLLHDHSPWTQRAYTIFDDMASRGSISAKLVLSELKYLDGELGQLSSQSNMAHHSSTTHLICESEQGGPEPQSMDIAPSLESGGYDQSLDIDFAESFGQQYELSPGQLMDLANSLDLDSLNWPFPSMGEFVDQNI